VAPAGCNPRCRAAGPAGCNPRCRAAGPAGRNPRCRAVALAGRNPRCRAAGPAGCNPSRLGHAGGHRYGPRSSRGLPSPCPPQAAAAARWSGDPPPQRPRPPCPHAVAPRDAHRPSWGLSGPCPGPGGNLPAEPRAPRHPRSSVAGTAAHPRPHGRPGSCPPPGSERAPADVLPQPRCPRYAGAGKPAPPPPRCPKDAGAGKPAHRPPCRPNYAGAGMAAPPPPRCPKDAGAGMAAPLPPRCPKDAGAGKPAHRPPCRPNYAGVGKPAPPPPRCPKDAGAGTAAHRPPQGLPCAPHRHVGVRRDQLHRAPRPSARLPDAHCQSARYQSAPYRRPPAGHALQAAPGARPVPGRQSHSRNHAPQHLFHAARTSLPPRLPPPLPSRAAQPGRRRPVGDPGAEFCPRPGYLPDGAKTLTRIKGQSTKQ
jgi:hypothetical protein